MQCGKRPYLRVFCLTVSAFTSSVHFGTLPPWVLCCVLGQIWRWRFCYEVALPVKRLCFPWPAKSSVCVSTMPGIDSLLTALVDCTLLIPVSPSVIASCSAAGPRVRSPQQDPEPNHAASMRPLGLYHWCHPRVHGREFKVSAQGHAVILPQGMDAFVLH